MGNPADVAARRGLYLRSRRSKEGVLEPLIAELREVLLGPWTMILVAALSLAGLAIGLSVTIMKVLELVEALFVEIGDRLRAKRNRARRADHHHDVRSRSRRQPSVPG
jgi:hypothetical protein